MINFHNISIKNKLRMIILLTSGIVLLLASGAFIIDELLGLRRHTVNDLFVLADLVGINSSAGLLFYNNTTVEENIAALQADTHITVTHVFSADGELFASYFKPGITPDSRPADSTLSDYYFASSPESTQIEDNYFFHDDDLEVFKQIIFKGKMLGTVYSVSRLGTYKNSDKPSSFSKP